METHIRALADQMENLTPFIRKSRNVRRDAGAEYGNGDPDHVCYYWRKPGHIAARCEKNPKKGKRCDHYGKKGHVIEDCWVRRKQVRWEKEERNKKEKEEEKKEKEEKEEKVKVIVDDDVEDMDDQSIPEIKVKIRARVT